MTGSCFIPGCKSGYHGKKTHLFKFPRNGNDQLKSEWNKFISKRDGKKWDFHKSRLCFLHFEDKYIVKERVVSLNGEIMAREPKIHWTLTHDAVPTQFSNSIVPEYFDVTSKKIKPPVEGTNIAFGIATSTERKMDCCVPGCQNTSVTDNLSFHELPQDAIRREEWMKVLNIENDGLICSAHIKDNQCNTFRLSNNAIPIVPKKSSIAILTGNNATVGPVSAEFGRSLPNVRVVLHRLPDSSTSFSSSSNKKQGIPSAKSLLRSQFTKPTMLESVQSLTIASASTPGCSKQYHFKKYERLGIPPTKKRRFDSNSDRNLNLLPTTPASHPDLQRSESRLALQLSPTSAQIVEGGNTRSRNHSSSLETGINKLKENTQINLLGDQGQGITINNKIQLPVTDSNFGLLVAGTMSDSIPFVANIRLPPPVSETPKMLSNYMCPNQSCSTDSDSDSLQHCIMCNAPISPKNIQLPFQGTQKIFENLLKILKLTSDDHEVLASDDCPLCLSCFRQAAALVTTYDELMILQDRFRQLKRDIISGLTNAFCQRKAREEDDELAKVFYDDVTISDKLMNELVGSKSGITRKVPVRTSAQTTVKNAPENMEFETYFEPYTQDTSQWVDVPFGDDDIDFELEYLDGPKPNDSEVLKCTVDPNFTIPDNTGEVEFCFDKKGKRKLHGKERWEALSKCPETKTGLEKLIPLYFRRITCPVCGDKFPPYLRIVNSHLALHTTLSESTIGEIKARLLSVSTETVPKKERFRLISKKLRILAKYTNGKAGPVNSGMVSRPVCVRKMVTESLPGHINARNGEKLYQCTLCPQKFYRHSNLIGHRREYHIQKVPFGKNKYFCDLCDYYYVFKSRYVNHILAQHSSEMDVNFGIFYFYNCDYKGCLKSYRQKEDFVQHLRTHDNVSFDCSSCDKVFASSENYKEHSSKLHNVHNDDGSQAHFDCMYCPEIFEIESDWTAHELTHAIDMSNEQRTHLCDECGKSYKTYQLLYIHKRKTHTKKLKAEIQIQNATEESMKKSKTVTSFYSRNKSLFINCHLCGKIVRKIYLTNHLLDTHTYENRVECYICRQTYKKYTTLDNHIRSHLGQPLNRKTAREVCIYCREEFPSKLRLREHCIKKHRDVYLVDKPFHCLICFLEFEKNEELSAHQLAVHEKHKCKVCSKQLFDQSKFEDHARSHTGERPFKCKICDKGFSVFYNLREHEMRHRGDKPYSCVHCNLGFFRKNKLQEHIENEHDGRN